MPERAICRKGRVNTAPSSDNIRGILITSRLKSSEFRPNSCTRIRIKQTQTFGSKKCASVLRKTKTRKATSEHFALYYNADVNRNLRLSRLHKVEWRVFLSISSSDHFHHQQPFLLGRVSNQYHLTSRLFPRKKYFSRKATQSLRPQQC